ncbi:hypothetical protein GO730_18175 [Spirosoma sp. HMF3257]|uniref:Lipocalin-like domain-containing protein n=1 Tax=Spirosoma telluris TaxID=2183553 RepID=A0A327NLF8_9BACT|nr:hypothetical protein [Spirosoma telluris]RAI75595.1 hypothetical protein HMF3257_18100 [Spirosoma telluris]
MLHKMTIKTTCYALTIFLLTLVMGCSKKEDAVAAPDLAAFAAGTYTVTSVTSGGKTYTGASIITGTAVVLSRVSDNVVSVVQKVPGKSDITLYSSLPLSGTTTAISFQHKATNGTISGSLAGRVLSYNTVFNDDTSEGFIASK